MILLKPFWLMTKKRTRITAELNSEVLTLASSVAKYQTLLPGKWERDDFSLQKSALAIRWGWSSRSVLDTQGEDQDTFPFGNSYFWEFSQILNPWHIVLNQTFFCCLCILEDTEGLKWQLDTSYGLLHWLW